MDIKVAFLSAKLEKLVYMHFPKGFEGPKGKVLKVLRAIYGLPESMRIFVEHFQSVLLSLGFKQARADKAVYVLNKGESFVWIPVFVDDMFAMENDAVLYDNIMKEI